MLDVALKLLAKLTSNSYEAYIVGGFVRDYLLGIESHDIDIATNATPKEIKKLFEDSCLPNEEYGSVTVILKGIRFEITTFRKEIAYENNRKPVEIKYIDSLKDDLTRRDFTMNALCMNEKGEILDYIDGKKDIEAHLIKTIGDAREKFEEDSLRILRAVRFAATLDFSLSKEVEEAIKEKKYLLNSLSYYRKREELDKIFTSSNINKGIKLLIDLGLDEELELPNLSKLLNRDRISIIGIWSILNVTDKYPFNKNELDLIEKINHVIELNQNDPLTMYNYGLYINSVVGEIKGQDLCDITRKYNDLVIKSRKEIDIDSATIMKILNRGSGEYLRIIYNDLEKEILYKRLENEKDKISKYILSHYKN